MIFFKKEKFNHDNYIINSFIKKLRETESNTLEIKQLLFETFFNITKNECGISFNIILNLLYYAYLIKNN